MASKTLTETQKKAIVDADAYMKQAFEEARRRLSDAGLAMDNDAHFECLLCDCEGYTPGPGGGCSTPGCRDDNGHRHSFFSHNLPL